MEKSARHCAMDMLARREHTQFELIRKLRVKGFQDQEINSSIEQLTLENLQSDRRFAENYVAYRARAGIGPQKIRAELQQRGINEGLVDDCIGRGLIDWLDVLRAVIEKKYRGDLNFNDRDERERRIRFLLQRGFGRDQISEVLKEGHFKPQKML